MRNLVFKNLYHACTIAKSKLQKKLKPEEARSICEKEIKNQK
tara:strand:+ start:179 stop:304 length:126 start_codon:yes stop_codon:yes gene_type:complete